MNSTSSRYKSGLPGLKALPFLILIMLSFTILSCKKTEVDASNAKSLQSSINDMASSLNTLQQVKFNEALYIIKTFAVEAEGDHSALMEMGKLINGMKVPQIFSLADSVANKHGIDWSSTGPPSLGEMNIFGNEEARESDPNDISASSLSLHVSTLGNDEVLGPKSLQIVPRLLDQRGKLVDFSGAGLEVVMEVFSGGNRILQSKNLMQDNNFKGFTMRFSSLPAQKIVNNAIDITVSVKTTKKTLKMTKVGVDVNDKALLMPAGKPADSTAAVSPPSEYIAPDFNETQPSDTPSTQAGDPKNTVSKFLSSLSSQNLRGAYETSDNPAWGSFEQFSNPTTGFGGVKNVTVKNITTTSATPKTSSVNATYDVVDKNGNTTAIQVTFGLKNTGGEWKIASYKIK